MDRKTSRKIKKYYMVLWCVVGGCSLLVILLAALSLSGLVDLSFSPVIGIAVPAMAGLGAAGQIITYFKENRLDYRLAEAGQESEIMAVFSAAASDMAALGIDQWDEEYPNISDIMEDIKNKEMYTVRQGKELIAVYTLNAREAAAYKFGSFKDKSGRHKVLHRLCVRPEYQHMGMASQILAHIEASVKKEGVSSVRLDVFTKNPRAMELYKRAGYSYAGDAYFRKGKFHLMEKLL